MHPNGVSHMEVSNDQEGVDRILEWLSYVPATVEHPPPTRPVTDPIEREVCRLFFTMGGMACCLQMSDEEAVEIRAIERFPLFGTTVFSQLSIIPTILSKVDAEQRWSHYPASLLVFAAYDAPLQE